MLVQEAVGFVGRHTLLLLLLLLGLLVRLGSVLCVRVMLLRLLLVVTSQGTQADQTRVVGLRSRGESRLGLGVLGMLWGGAVAIHQSVLLGNRVLMLMLVLMWVLVLVRSVQLL